jgi:hypothetical protein
MSRFRLALIGILAVTFLGGLLLPRLEAVGRGTNGAQRTPVLVELFTSEGCSDCPPADALLEKLDRSQPVRGAEAIVLSEHVDYWNDIGWRDPYSSHEYSVRQSALAGHFGLGSVYTPQMVVDGRIELVGSDERGAIQAIENAAKAEKIPVSLTSILLEGNKTVTLHVKTGPLPASIGAESANVFVAVVDDSDESHVSRGENAGRTLKHVAVVRTLARVGTVDKAAEFSDDVRINLASGNSRNMRLVAFVQDETAGRIWGVGSGRLSN